MTDTANTSPVGDWEMIGSDGTTLLDGIDCAFFDDDGRITYLAGFVALETARGRLIDGLALMQSRWTTNRRPLSVLRSYPIEMS